MTVLAADLGGTRIKLGIVRDGRVLAEQTIDAQAHNGLAQRLPAMQQTLEQMCQPIGIDPAACRGVGIGFPGIVDVPNRRVTAVYGKFDDAIAMDLPAWFHKHWNLPAVLENDARLATLGEWRHGAGRGCDDLVMVTLGTGIGTSVVMNGRIVRGAHGQAGCLGGHLSVKLDGRRCICGNVGCAETEASTAHLDELARAHPDYAASALAELERIDYAAIFRLAAEGEPVATALRDRSLSVWGAVIVSLIHAYDPQRVILGGGIMRSGEIILPAIRRYIDEHAETPWGRVELCPAELADGAALAGAEVLVDELIGR